MKISFQESQYNIFNSINKVSVIDDCYIDRTGFVIKDGRIIFGPAIEHLCWLNKEMQIKFIRSEIGFNDYNIGNIIFDRMTAFNEFISDKIKNSGFINYDKTTLHLMHPFKVYQYGHFFDTFQKLMNVDRSSIDSMMISNHRLIRDFHLHLSALGFGDVEIINMPSENTLAHFKRVIYPHPVSVICDYQETSYNFIRKNYFKFFNVNSDSNCTTKLFLTRRPGISRFLKNHEPLHAQLEDARIKIIDGSEPLGDIVHLFSNASHVAGYHGAIFVNTLFCGKSTKFLEYCPKERPFNMFKNQYRLSDHYQFELIDADDQLNATLPLDQLLKFYSS